MIVEWLVPVAVFWMAGAMYLGGAPIRIEGGAAVRQLGGLAVSFALFLTVWWGLRALIVAVTGPILAVALAALGALILLPFVCKAGFRILGVRLVPDEGGHHGEPHPA